MKVLGKGVCGLALLIVVCCGMKIVPNSRTQAWNGEYFLASTFNFEGPVESNNSLFVMNPLNTKIMVSTPFPAAIQMTSSAYDSKHNLYFISDGDYLFTYNVTDLSGYARVILQKDAVQMAYDTNLDKLIAVTMRDENLIEEIDLKTGRFTPLFHFDNYYGLLLGASTYDSETSTYWIGIDDLTKKKNDGEKFAFMEASIKEKKVKGNTYLVGDVDESHYDYKNKRIIACNITTLVSIPVSTLHQYQNTRNPITPTVIGQLPPGLPGLYGTGFNSDTQHYYASLILFEKLFVGTYDVQNKKVVSYVRNYDMLIHAHAVAQD